MNQGKFIVALLADFKLRRFFGRIVQNHEENKNARTFTCWNQMLCIVLLPDKTPGGEALAKCIYKDVKELKVKQLKISLTLM